MVQELRGLEVEREALLFQVDVLQDTLEGVEELLAEAQREVRQAGVVSQRYFDAFILGPNGHSSEMQGTLPSRPFCV